MKNYHNPAARIRAFLVIFLAFAGFSVSGQKQNLNWHFGNGAGVTFINGYPQAITSALSTREGVASISHPITGDVLFYTDGITIYNKNDVSMYSSLTGDPSSTQSAIIVPIYDALNPHRYYEVFVTSTCASTTVTTLTHCRVDMTLNSGLGGVSIAPPGTPLLTNSSEKLTATVSSDGMSSLVVAHEIGGGTPDKFHVFQVSLGGVSPYNTQQVGTSLSCTSGIDPSTGIGYMRFSQDGSMLAVANFQRNIEVYDFDKSTGGLTLKYTLYVDPGDHSLPVYGLEFSKNKRFLYASSATSAVSPAAHDGNIYQFDLSSGDETTVQGTLYEVTPSDKDGYGALQYAPDGKIYIAKEGYYNTGTTSLSVIANPELSGAGCGFIHNGFALASGKYVLMGLPNFTSFIQPDFKTTLCLAEEDESYEHLTTQTITANTVWSGKYYIDGTITFDNCLVDITNVDLVFADASSGLTFTNGAYLRSNNSVYRPCAEIDKWHGLEFDNSSSGIFNENTVKNAEAGISQDAGGTIKITSNEFYNCDIAINIYSVYGVSSCQSSISFNRIKVRNENRGITYNGIRLTNTDLKEAISQNEFDFTAEFSTAFTDAYDGIILNSSSCTVSQNQFTDLFRSYVNTYGSAISSVENNTIEITKGNFFSEQQIVIIGENEPITIKGNKISSANAYEYAGHIWIGIYCLAVNMVNILDNEINNMQLGIEIDANSSDCKISGNKITNFVNYGIRVTDSYNVEIACNIINGVQYNETDFFSIGIAYDTYFNAETEEHQIRIKNNCIFETKTAILIQNNNPSDPLPNLPAITNNFLYNYGKYGVYVEEFAGDIGFDNTDFAESGRNTFLSNNDFAIDVATTSGTFIGEAGNYGIRYVSADVTRATPTTNEFASIASCGQQVSNQSSTVDYSKVIPTAEENCNDILHSELSEFTPSNLILFNPDPLANVHKAARSGNILSLIAALKANNVFDFNKLETAINSSKKLNDTARKQMLFFLNYSNNRLDKAMALISSFDDGSKDCKDRMAILQIIISRRINKTHWSEFAQSDLSTLENIAGKESDYRNLAITILNLSGSGRSLVLGKTPIPQDIPMSEIASRKYNELTLYPNPCQDVLKLNYYTTEQVKEKPLVVITNILGQPVMELELEVEGNGIEVNVSGLKPGVYFINVKNYQETQTRKFIKQ